MPICYKNFPITVGGVDLYANSATLNEGLGLESAESYGIVGSRAVFNTSIPEGSLSIDSYIKSSITPLLDLVGSNSQGLDVTFGKYTLPKPAIISSIGINVAVGSPPSLSMEIVYFGTVTTGAAPAPVAPTAAPANIEGVTLGGFDKIGVAGSIQNITYNLTQNYESHTLLGQVRAAPIVIFQDGSAALNLDCHEMMPSGLTQEDKSCLANPNPYSVSILGCGGVDYGTINISSGYLQDRSESIDTASPPSASVSIIEYL